MRQKWLLYINLVSYNITITVYATSSRRVYFLLVGFYYYYCLVLSTHMIMSSENSFISALPICILFYFFLLSYCIISDFHLTLIRNIEKEYILQFSSVQSLSHVWLFATPWITARQASLSITNSQSLLKLMPIKLVMPSNNLILWHHLPLLPSIFPSIRVFSNESALRIRWPKYWSFSFSISPSNEHPGLISFRMDWMHLLSVQGTLKSLLQHHSSKASWCLAFFII